MSPDPNISDGNIPAWPAAMKAKTAARYLEIGASTFSRLRKRYPDFPEKDPRLDRWRKADIDRWLHRSSGDILSPEDLDELM